MHEWGAGAGCWPGIGGAGGGAGWPHLLTAEAARCSRAHSPMAPDPSSRCGRHSLLLLACLSAAQAQLLSWLWSGNSAWPHSRTSLQDP